MSDPMTNIDGDDVLASIRRLVSQTHAPQTAPVQQKTQAEAAEAQPAAEPVPSGDDARLILTPNLRVIEEAEAQTSEHDAAQAEADIPDAIDTREDAAATAEVAPLLLKASDAVEVQEDAQEDIQTHVEDTRHTADAVSNDSSHFGDAPIDIIEDAVEIDTQDSVQGNVEGKDAFAQDGEASAETVETSSESQDASEASETWDARFDDTPNAHAADHAAGLTLEQRIAELESAVSQTPQDWEPDGSEDMTDDAAFGFSEAGARVLHFRGMDASAVMASEAQDADVREAGVQDAETTADLAEDQSAHAPQAVEAEIVAAEADTAKADSAEANGSFDEAVADEALAPAGYAEDEMFDEEALRELISAVLREELQGVLGERITRNVRRLVRKEVQNALTLKTFE